MKTTIFMPKKINVGFQERSGTYTGKLAYIIYFDDKGKLRKENSWNSWRDQKIDNQIFENVPTEGFVLNKKVGDYVSYWNHRQAYVRVYDPRDFEFEITVQNLLYILENTSSIKGKGLEGKFVYGWDGKDLVLLPCDSPDYKEISNWNEKVHNQIKLKGKDLKLGGTYLSRGNVELVYLGRYDLWQYEYEKNEEGIWQYKYGNIIKKWETKGKAYFFVNKNTKCITIVKSLSKDIIEVISEECVENYAELFEELEKDTRYSPVDNTKDELIYYTLEEFKEKFEERKNRSTWFHYIEFISQLNKKKKIRINKVQGDWYKKNDSENYGKYYVEERYEVGKKNYWNTTNWETKKIYFDTVEDIFNYYNPQYLREYLKNGKLYSEVK